MPLLIFCATTDSRHLPRLPMATPEASGALLSSIDAILDSSPMSFTHTPLVWKCAFCAAVSSAAVNDLRDLDDFDRLGCTDDDDAASAASDDAAVADDDGSSRRFSLLRNVSVVVGVSSWRGRP